MAEADKAEGREERSEILDSGRIGYDHLEVYDMMKDASTFHDALVILNEEREKTKNGYFPEERRMARRWLSTKLPLTHKYGEFLVGKLTPECADNSSLSSRVEDLFLRRGDLAIYNRDLEKDIEELKNILPGADVLDVKGHWESGVLPGAGVLGIGASFAYGATEGLLTAMSTVALYGLVKMGQRLRYNMFDDDSQKKAREAALDEIDRRRDLITRADFCDHVIGKFLDRQ